MDPLVAVLVAVGCFLLLLACIGWNQPRIALAIENWGQSVNGLEEPADLFYARVYQRLQDRLNEAGLPDSTIGFGPGHLFGNRTIFSARPQYLIVRYSHLTIYIYAFRLPGGLYVSYWAFSKYTLWMEHPILKWLVFWRNFQMTLYQFDVTNMCLGMINGTLHEVIDEYCAERGLKPLEDYERRPVLQSFYAKYRQGNQPSGGYGPGGYGPHGSGPSGYVMPLPPSGPAPLLPASSPPASNPPIANSPASNPPASNPPASNPPIANSPMPVPAPSES